MREKRLQIRTHYIHRIKYSTQEKLVGAFVFFALIILVWLLFSSGKSLGNFGEYYQLHARLESIQQLDEETEIIIGGLSAGRVKSVEITDDNHIIVVMNIFKRYQRLIRTDSIARLNAFDLGMIKQSIIEISVGSPEQAVLSEGSTIVIRETVNLKKILVKFIPTIEALFETINRVNNLLAAVEQQKLEKTLNHVDGLIAAIEPDTIKELLASLHLIISKTEDGIPVSIKSVDELVAAIDLDKLKQSTDIINQLLAVVKPQTIGAVVDNLHKTSDDIRDISHQIKTGKGVIGSSVYDKKVQGHFEQTLYNLSKVSVKLDSLLKVLNKEVKYMPGLLNKIEPMINEVDKTIKATQKIWPISSAIENKADKTLLISPELNND